MNTFENYWKKFNETSISEKKDFGCQLSMEDITDADYTDAKRVCKDFKIKNLCEYHGFYVQSHTLLLAYVFQNFRNMFLEIYKLNTVCFLFLAAPGLTWQAASKKTKVKSDLSLTDFDMLLRVEKGKREVEYVVLFINTQKVILNTWKIMIKIKNHHNLSIGM